MTDWVWEIIIVALAVVSLLNAMQLYNHTKWHRMKMKLDEQWYKKYGREFDEEE